MAVLAKLGGDLAVGWHPLGSAATLLSAYSTRSRFLGCCVTEECRLEPMSGGAPLTSTFCGVLRTADTSP